MVGIVIQSKKLSMCDAPPSEIISIIKEEAFCFFFIFYQKYLRYSLYLFDNILKNFMLKLHKIQYTVFIFDIINEDFHTNKIR